MSRLLHEQYNFFGTWLEIISGCPSKHPVLSRLQILKFIGSSPLTPSVPRPPYKRDGS